MFKIGEFSNLVRVSARMLRHYEKCGLLYPAEIDRFTGYRLYSAVQIPLLNRIVALRDTGFTIEEISALLQHADDARYLRNAIAHKRREIEASITKEQERLVLLNHLDKTMEGKSMGTIYDVELKRLPAVDVLSTRAVLPAYDQEGELWHKLGTFIAQHNIACATGGYSIYLDEEYKETDVLVEVAMPVDALGEDDGDFTYKTLPEIPVAATIRFQGPYDQYAAAIEKLGQWMESNHYAFAGLVRGLAIVAPGDPSKPENFLTELQVPVVKK